jgi:hypothetical protein
MDGCDYWLIHHVLDCFGDVCSYDHFSQVGSLLDLFGEDDVAGCCTLFDLVNWPLELI